MHPERCEPTTHSISCVLDLLPLATEACQNLSTLVLSLERDALGFLKPSGTVFQCCRTGQQPRSVARGTIRFVRGGRADSPGRGEQVRPGELSVHVLGHLFEPVQICFRGPEAGLVLGPERLGDPLYFDLHLRDLKKRTSLALRQRRGGRAVICHFVRFVQLHFDPSESRSSLFCVDTYVDESDGNGAALRSPPRSSLLSPSSFERTLSSI